MIELLTVVAIIGVLAAIAIPQFVVYRQSSYDGMAQADLRNAVSAEEAHYSSFETYVSCSDASTCQSLLKGYNRSDPGVTLEMTGTVDAFTGTASHTKGSGSSWGFDSVTGRVVFHR